MELGPLLFEYEVDPRAMLSEEIRGSLPGLCQHGIGSVNGVLDNTATVGLHELATGAGVTRKIMIPVGIQAAPAMGDPVYCAILSQLGYQGVPEAHTVTVSIPFGMPSVATNQVYDKPWGVLLHAKEAATDANTANTNVNNGAASSKGGYLIYHIFSVTGEGTAEISVDDSSNGTTWTALSGATSGSLAHTAMPCAGVVELGATATVKQYLRWQLALTDITSLTFALGFVRG
jgi:hypothetical protein